jgi:tetratricopeptide (TPR) repeat protein
MHLRPHFRQIISYLLLVVLAVGLGAAQADEYLDVSRLIKAKQLPEALTKVDQFLAGKPRDPQLRFLKGVIQSEMGKTSEAISSFVRLTEDHPELPEPYNNLAVIYANAGQFDKSRTALEMAIRTNPSYSTAHENLGDIYAKLASQSYAKALQLDNSNVGVPPKLALIRDLFTPIAGAAGRSAPPTPTSTPTTPTPSPAAVPTPPAPATTAPATPVVASVQPKVPTMVLASPTGANQPSVAPSNVTNALESRNVESAVANWAKAWSERNLAAYLASYSKDFAPSNKQSHAVWQEERKVRIMGKARISVKLSNIVTSVNGLTATVKFKQDYKADALSASSHKTLELTKQGDRWLITKEIAG